MPLIEWRDEFNTGIGSVDHEHRELVDLINAVDEARRRQAPKEEVGAALGEIHARIAAHFALEEQEMRDHAYDEYGAHKADHERLLDDIRDIMDDHEGDAYFRYNDALAGNLRAWFVNHFKTKDARLHRMLGV